MIKDSININRPLLEGSGEAEWDKWEMTKAIELLRIPESIATPCSVKAWGSFLVPPHLEIPNWNIKFFFNSSNSSLLS